MSRNSVFARLRCRLDAAITYGPKKEARALARQGLTLARKQNLAGEAEYFSGQLDILAERFVSAIEHFDKAIARDPADGAAYNDRALCMVELGIIDESLPYFDKGIAAEPDYATIYHNKGWLLNNIGRYREALACFYKALELEPGRAVTYDNVADALFSLGDVRGAYEAYQKVLEFLPQGKCRSIARQIRKRIVDLEKTLNAKP